MNAQLIDPVSVLGTHSVCTECLLAIEYGPAPERVVLDARKRIAWCAGDADGAVAFSWAPCACCGSALGGERHEAITLGV